VRRVLALVVCLVLVAGACSGDDDDDDVTSPTTTERPTTTSTRAVVVTNTTRPSATPAISADCPGIGAFGGAPEITFLRAGRLWAVAADGSGERCLAEYGEFPALAWSGDGSRVLVGLRGVQDAAGPVDLVPDDMEAVGWSRPTGKALLARGSDDILTKLSVDGEPPLPLFGLPPSTREALYHPAGTAIAEIEGGPTNVVLATNRGESPRWLLTNETADDITEIEFTADGDLLLVAKHGTSSHVHRLVLGSEVLETVFERVGDVHSVTASPFANGDYAFSTDGGCGDERQLHLFRDDEPVDVPESVSAGTVAGWLPDGSALVVVRPEGCDIPDGDLFTVDGTDAQLIAEDVEAAAARAQLPPPPPPPPAIEAAPA
jgi:hypothetical protein